MTSPLHTPSLVQDAPLAFVFVPRCRREQRPLRISTASSCWQYLRSHKQDIELADDSLLIQGSRTNRLCGSTPSSRPPRPRCHA